MRIATATAAMLALAAAIGPADAATKNSAEMNFASTHPGTRTGTTALLETRATVIRPKGEVTGLLKTPQPAMQSVNFTGTQGRGYSPDDLPAGFDIRRRSPSK